MKTLKEMTIEEVEQLAKEVYARLEEFPFEVRNESSKKRSEEFCKRSKMEQYEHYLLETEKIVKYLIDVAEAAHGEIDNLLFCIPEEAPDREAVVEKWSDIYDYLDGVLEELDELIKG